MSALTPTQIKTASKDLVYRARVNSAAADTDVLLFEGAGVIERAVIVNATANAGFIQVHDADELPANTAVPIWSRVLPANGEVVIEDIYCADGAVLAVSTTGATLTISTNNAAFFANFRR
jgi:hypothetical protein